MAVTGRLAWLLLLFGAGDPFPPGKCVERLKADVYYLSSDTLEGRGLATPGVALAAQHIRAEFKRIGLKSGVADSSYFQPFEHGSAGAELYNVVVVLEGKGELAKETIVIGAHFDHLGHGERHSLAPNARKTRIRPGADDNASGVAAIMELARRFASRGTPPKRRLVFVAFCGEESGQLGSRHYVKQPIGDTVAMLNFDMVGRLRDDRLGIAGNDSAREFAAILESADAKSPLKLMLGGPEYPDDSDHGPFAAAKVPLLYVCTGGHDDRHTPGDTADKVNFEGMAKVVDFGEDVLDRLQDSARPVFVPPPAHDGDGKAKSGESTRDGR